MKEIPNFPGYFISKDGKIWSDPKKHNHKEGKFLKPGKINNGYLIVSLCKNRKKYNRLVHRLVLETFVGLCPKGMETRHLNGNPADNRLENLQWGTYSDNVKDAIKHGTRVDNSGEKCYRAKLTERDVRMIVYMWRTGLFKQKEIADIYSVNYSSICSIVNKRTWKFIWR